MVPRRWWIAAACAVVTIPVSGCASSPEPAPGAGQDVETAAAAATTGEPVPATAPATTTVRGPGPTTWLVCTGPGSSSTHTGELKLAALVAPLAQPMPDGAPDLVVTEGAINLRRPAEPARVAAIVRHLQARP